MLLINTLVIMAIAAGVVAAFIEDGKTAPNCCDW